MKPTLTFEKMEILRGKSGSASSLPDLGGMKILQNQLTFHLGETEEIYKGYGTLPSAYPYRQYTTYNRKLRPTDINTAVLENDYIKAIFLPELGGRLWSLTDKTTGKKLLYTNDVIRFSNLSTRNAWFSGGVEWNMGIIGHSPLSNEPLFTASGITDSGVPFLRMYEYERIREAEYQMDFWLEEGSHTLNCRMRIVNHTDQVIPMYWWSNMAVPEYSSGQIIVPAATAYTCKNHEVYKVNVPEVDGNNIFHYESIPDQTDYFFDIPCERPKYIANVNADGYGLLQASTQRLRARKLFSWGHNEGSNRWQHFLTDDAGSYLEIQAGLGKTQYGCLPMAPHTAWEWLEQYGPVQLPQTNSSQEACHYIEQHFASEELDHLLRTSASFAHQKAAIVSSGSAYGAMRNLETKVSPKKKPLSAHLDFGTCSENEWTHLLTKGNFVTADPTQIPGDFQCSSIYYEHLKKSVKTADSENWYAHYHLGLMHWFYGKYKKARKALKRSIALQPSAWAYHALAVLAFPDKEKCVSYIRKGLVLCDYDLSYVKEAFRIFISAEAFSELLDCYSRLPEKIQTESRIHFCYLTALSKTGQYKKGYDILIHEPDYVLDDIREGEDSISDLYSALYKGVFGEVPKEIPAHWNFNSFI